eukprot:CAMPEP_0115394548 /NCGR_PEP_ID=MMETSP0271-20121206/12323_1 /TAXON_ID=71861 /ORGANISM="Scrippsiella trochoidea, Strain CCMP3099" /LENGTH=427 /DNA_ID=CAMNT_0002818223 /DNA_START=69 /DNA_END=1353 /DNA_ORIENTATION=-
MPSKKSNGQKRGAGVASSGGSAKMVAKPKEAPAPAVAAAAPSSAAAPRAEAATAPPVAKPVEVATKKSDMFDWDDLEASEAPEASGKKLELEAAVQEALPPAPVELAEAAVAPEGAKPPAPVELPSAAVAPDEAKPPAPVELPTAAPAIAEVAPEEAKPLAPVELATPAAAGDFRQCSPECWVTLHSRFGQRPAGEEKKETSSDQVGAKQSKSKDDKEEPKVEQAEASQPPAGSPGSDSEGSATRTGGTNTPIMAQSRTGSNSDLDAGAAAPRTCRVNFVCDSTQPGECLALIGSDVALGAWDTGKAVILTTSAAAFPTWSADIPAPAAGSEFKLVISRGNGNVSWEPIAGNRTWPSAVVADPIAVTGSECHEKALVGVCQRKILIADLWPGADTKVRDLLSTAAQMQRKGAVSLATSPAMSPAMPG